MANDFEEVDHSRSHVVWIESVAIRIADDRTIVVVGSEDDKASLANVKDVIASVSPVGIGGLDQIQLVTLTSELEIGFHK